MSKIAYKGFDVNNDNQLYCRNMIYELDKEYSIDGNLKLCENGMHFCWDIKDVHWYYDFDESTICEVEILGDIVEGKNKACTNKLKILRILNKDEVMELSNKGISNNGYFNIGNNNKGNSNKGNDNEGYDNKGNNNKGDDNEGNNNIGNRNKGNDNIGFCNKGDNIIGFFNTINDIGSLDDIALFNKLSGTSMEEFKQMNVYILMNDNDFYSAFPYTVNKLISRLPNFDKDIFNVVMGE